VRRPDAVQIPPFDDPAWLDALRAQMLRFARQQLADEALAEDAVQEALLGALKGAQGFAGRAAYRTWVYGILKHKIADLLRQRARSPVIGTGGAADEDAQDLGELFDARGHWTPLTAPAAWADPEASFDDRQFWRVFEACLDGLPPQQGRVFMMREFLGLEAVEICKNTGVSATNLYVLLHRARLRLRECLQGRWFGEDRR
jgi:RNA polymerase sigma-70 factor (ECF subfamily)